MLKNVKASYFLRVLFSYMDEKQKLELIRYNKSLQENMNISLINYKLFSGKYIEYESNSKGKEYNYDNILLFEGEYLNGKRWTGKGFNLKRKVEYEIKNGNGCIKNLIKKIN